MLIKRTVLLGGSLLLAGFVLSGCLPGQDGLSLLTGGKKSGDQDLPPVVSQVDTADSAEEAVDTALEEMDAAFAGENEETAFPDDLTDSQLGL